MDEDQENRIDEAVKKLEEAIDLLQRVDPGEDGEFAMSLVDEVIEILKEM